MNPELWLDERGRRCPIPVIALARNHTQWQNEGAASSRTVGVLADDPAAQYDIPAWCRLKGAEFLGELNPPDDGSGVGYVVRFNSEKQPG
jgi:TusA-related sulfurtransferase